MARTPCIRCTKPVIGGGQFCSDCESQQESAESIVSPAKVRYAGFWLRLVAYLIDLTVILTSALIVLAIFGFYALIFWSPMPLVYYIYFERRFGATPGKLVLGMRIQMSNGDPLTPKAAGLRNFGHWLSMMMFGAPFLMVAFTARK